jgi:hypothetical protein
MYAQDITIARFAARRFIPRLRGKECNCTLIEINSEHSIACRRSQPFGEYALPRTDLEHMISRAKLC